MRTIFVSIGDGFNVYMPSIRDMAWVGPTVLLAVGSEFPLMTMSPMPYDGLDEEAGDQFTHCANTCLPVGFPPEEAIDLVLSLHRGGCYIKGNMRRDEDEFEEEGGVVRIDLP